MIVTAAYACLLRGTDAAELKVLFHARAPYYSQSGEQVTGLIADRTAEVFQKAGIAFFWEEMPPKRQLVTISKNLEPVCAAGWFKNPEREAFARYTLPIYQDRPTVVLTRQDATAVIIHKRIDGLLADVRATLLIRDGYSYGAFLDDRINAVKPKMTATSQTNAVMADMITRGRADYMFMAEEEAISLLGELAFDGGGLALHTLDDMPVGNKRHIICSQQVSTAIIEALDRVIEALNEAKVDDAS
ncbi:transporter substrate-binding domain-containing protein [Kiloniella laminariae]|uniref:Transporter substrate-binding domain-containing protein n=1 Tax=Kiloniella laminariae TaxID=454162 RepID=A0ABT4LPK2_9PROT|nr:transporter substrate-binding domain-containing protein [Kiloniella laminariae]MCZ4282825.1 transporter substrate-binding domain-containing protein [Kiloniella laminariae]